MPDQDNQTRILFLSHSSIWGGAERCLYLLLKGIDGQKYKPLVVLPGEGLLTEKIKGLGFQTHLVKLEWCVSTAENDGEQYVRFSEGLRERVHALVGLIGKEKIDLVFTNTAVILEGALAAQLCGIPHIWHIHELISRDPALFPFLDPSAFYTLLKVLTDKFVVVSRSVEAEMKQFIQTERIEVVYNGIDFSSGRYIRRNKEKIFGFDKRTPTVSFVGMLSKRKGVLNLVDTASLVIQRFPEIKFVIAGPDAGVFNIMLRRLKEEKIDHAFKFLGFRADVLNIIASSDIFILPSLVDPLPVVLLEAMITGKPIVATQSGGAAEMVVHDKTGLLVPVNDPSALAQAIISLLENPRRMELMGGRAKERVRTVFSCEEYIKNFERVFDEIGSKKKHDDPVAKELTAAILALVEAAAAEKGKIIEQQQKLEGLEIFRDKVRNYPVYKIYHWLKYLGRLHDRTPL